MDNTSMPHLIFGVADGPGQIVDRASRGANRNVHVRTQYQRVAAPVRPEFSMMSI